MIISNNDFQPRFQLTYRNLLIPMKIELYVVVHVMISTNYIVCSNQVMLMDEKNVCLICREEEIEPNFITRCNLRFHMGCLKVRFEEQKHCPYCQIGITLNAKVKAFLIQKI